MKQRISNTKKHKILQLYYEGTSANAICHDYHIAHSTLYKWLTDYPKDSMIRARLKKEKPINLSRILSHSRKIEAEIDFLHRTVVDTIPLKERIKIIDSEYGKESLHVQCDALNVNRATYLNHKYRNKNDDAWFIKREAKYTEIIKKIYEDSGHVYGAKKIAKVMRKQGNPVSDRYVGKIMAKGGLISARSSAYKIRKIVGRSMQEPPHSSQLFNPDTPNQVWVSDVTAVYIHNHYYYICVYLDLFSRKAVGYGISRRNSVQLIKKGFIDAYKERGQPKNLIIHTDNGGTYVSYSYNKALKERGVKHSFSRPRIPSDNAVAETFFNTLKREAILREDYPRSFRDLCIKTDAFMKRYNSKRLHEKLQYVTPDAYEANYKAHPSKRTKAKKS